MKNVAASVLARLKNLAKSKGLFYNEVLVRYVIERVLRRLELSSYASKCVLKGGSMFIVWNGGFSFRPTMDADLEFRGDGSPEALERVFREICDMPGCEEDGVLLDSGTVSAFPIREDDQYGGVRVTMTAKIGSVRVPIQFDVGIGDVITPQAKACDFPVMLDHSVPRLKVYPRETVVAEKFQTIVRRGFANSRMKDYYDLWRLSADENVDQEVAKLAVTRTFRRRQTELPVAVPEGLSDDFARDAAKVIQWRSFIRKNRLDVGTMSFADIVSTVRSFLMGLVDR